jgi:hypothetical protein
MHFFSVLTLMTLAHVLITIGVSIRIIKVRLPVATSLAWLVGVRVTQSRERKSSPDIS